jgi:intraflagellar transport protein 122
MYHYLENGEFELAHGVACIGVTSSDWLYLASRCLDELNLNMAKKAFAKASDYRKLVLIGNDQNKRECISSTCPWYRF